MPMNQPDRREKRDPAGRRPYIQPLRHHYAEAMANWNPAIPAPRPRWLGRSPQNLHFQHVLDIFRDGRFVFDD
jgi:hypothetical protein